MPGELLLPLETSFQRLMRELNGLSADELHAFRVEQWPRQIHWLGEDGTIAGILRHVTGWKQSLARALTPGNADRSESEGPSERIPAELPEETPDGMLHRLSEAQQEMLLSLGPYVGERPRPWPDHPVLEGMSLAKTIEVFQDHDRYHAAQVAYLRQRFLALHGNPREAGMS